MTAVEIPTIVVGVGDEWTLGDNTRPGNDSLLDSVTPVPVQPQDPPPPPPAEFPRGDESEGNQGTDPAEIPQQKNTPEADTASGIARSEKGKGPAEPVDDNSDSIPDDENDWMRYPIPSALNSTPDDLPEALLEIVRISVENVTARVAEAETRRLEEEARQRAIDEEAEAEAQKENEKGKGKEVDYLPIIIPDPEEENIPQEAIPQEDDWVRRRQALWSETASLESRSVNSTGSKDRGHKRHKLSVSRIFGRRDKGEPSTPGSAKNTRKSGKGAEATATNVLGERDAILRQLGVSVPKHTGRRSVERSSAPVTNHTLDMDPRQQLRAAAVLLQKNHDQPGHRPSTVGSVRRRVGGKVKKVIKEKVMDGSGNEGGAVFDNGNGEKAQSRDGQGASQSDGDSTEHEWVPPIRSHLNSCPTNTHRECISCFDDFLPETMVKAPCHSYCRDCFARLIANALQNEQQWPPKCCLNEIPFHTIYACIETDLRNTFQSRAREWSTPVGERVYCHEPECSVWLSADRIDAGRRTATCPRSHATCTICRGAAHAGSDCPEDRDVGRTNELAEAEGWKRCARCRALVEHGEACQHMTCRCGYEFCYVCTRVWRTCGCTMQQLTVVKAEAAARRREREEREAREETELQEALRKIEDLEVQEALEAIERSLERERTETLRRRREIADKVGEEEMRRAGVEVKYLECRQAMAALHDRQREAIDADVKEGMAAIKREKEAEMARMREEHDAELAGLRARGDARIEELQRELDAEFEERMAIERAVGEEYLAQLTTFWSGMKNDDAEINKAISAFRETMRARRREWEKWRDEEVEGARFVAGENLELRREGLAFRRGRREGEFRGREREEKRRGRAGEGWFGAVVEERQVLVREGEEREVGDALSFEAYDPVEVAIVREMLEKGEEIEVLRDEDAVGETGLGRTPVSWPATEAGPSGT